MQPASFAGERPVGSVHVPDIFGENASLGAFIVSGDCLNGDGIADGHVIIVDEHAPVMDGDIGVVRWTTGDGRTARMVKHVWREGTGLRLEPSNPDYQPIHVKAENSPVIVGKVVAWMFNPELVPALRLVRGPAQELQAGARPSLTTE